MPHDTAAATASATVSEELDCSAMDAERFPEMQGQQQQQQQQWGNEPASDDETTGRRGGGSR
jgi:hypothetical protein